MAEIESSPCKRGRFTFDDESWYITITDTSIMAHFPEEGGYKHKDIKSLLNLCCRLMSKLRDGRPMTWEAMAERAVRSGVGHKCLTDDLAAAILACQKEK